MGSSMMSMGNIDLQDARSLRFDGVSVLGRNTGDLSAEPLQPK